jgi:hypothetical protein
LSLSHCLCGCILQAMHSAQAVVLCLAVPASKSCTEGVAEGVQTPSLYIVCSA